MLTRWLLSFAMVVAIPLLSHAAPAVAGAKTSGAPVVFQLAPGAKLLEHVDSIIRTAAGDNLADVVKMQLKNHLGEKGFAGVDMTKPIVGCAFVPNKAIKNPEDFKDVYGFLAIPTTSEEEFKDFAARLTAVDPVTFTPVEGNKGLYSLATKNDEAEIPIRGRSHAGYFYIGFNVKDELMNANSLPTVASMHKASDTSLMYARLFLERFPAAWQEMQKEQLDEQLEKFNELGVRATWMGNLLNSYAKYMSKSSEHWKDTEEYGLRIIHDEKAQEIAFENYTIPKKGTAFASDIANIKPSTNHFTSLVSEKTAAALLLQLPIGTAELRDLIQKGIEAGEKNLDHVPDFGRPVVKELLAGLSRTTKADAIDFALSVNATEKDEPFQAVLAITFDDATKLEKALKEAVKHKDAPEDFKATFTFDVEKIDGVNVHKFTAPDVPDPISELFGTKDAHIVFGPKGIYVGIGKNPIPMLKAAMSGKPAPAKVFDLVANPKRLGDLVFAANPGVGGIARGMLGNENKQLSAMYVSYSGGTMNTVRVGMHLKMLPKVFGSVVGMRAGGGF